MIRALAFLCALLLLFFIGSGAASAQSDPRPDGKLIGVGKWHDSTTLFYTHQGSCEPDWRVAHYTDVRGSWLGCYSVRYTLGLIYVKFLDGDSAHIPLAVVEPASSI